MKKREYNKLFPHVGQNLHFLLQVKNHIQSNISHILN